MIETDGEWELGKSMLAARHDADDDDDDSLFFFFHNMILKVIFL